MVNADHPLWHLTSQLLGSWTGMFMEFSRYVYREHGVTDYRETFHVPADEIHERWLSNQLKNLQMDEELALHSRVEQKGATLHLPMIDFGGVASPEEISTRLKPISERLGRNPWLYSSGQSLHGYYFVLINESSWHRFLGELLLCNSKNQVPSELVDSRWIGHSLIQGFSALRWSQNTRRHSSLPYLLEAEDPRPRTLS